MQAIFGSAGEELTRAKAESKAELMGGGRRLPRYPRKCGAANVGHPALLLVGVKSPTLRQKGWRKGRAPELTSVLACAFGAEVLVALVGLGFGKALGAVLVAGVDEAEEQGMWFQGL